MSQKNAGAGEQTLIRDQLAKERTSLANERTFLAYIRTSVTTLAAAVTLIQFFIIKAFVILGYILIPLSLFLFCWGIYRHKKTNRNIKGIMQGE